MTEYMSCMGSSGKDPREKYEIKGNLINIYRKPDKLFISFRMIIYIIQEMLVNYVFVYNIIRLFTVLYLFVTTRVTTSKSISLIKIKHNKMLN